MAHQNFRHPEILEIARRDGKVTVEDLARRFGVTLQTIRRDLGELADAGRLERVHGGAVVPSGVSNVIDDVANVYNAGQDMWNSCEQAGAGIVSGLFGWL